MTYYSWIHSVKEIKDYLENYKFQIYNKLKYPRKVIGNRSIAFNVREPTLAFLQMDENTENDNIWLNRCKRCPARTNRTGSAGAIFGKSFTEVKMSYKVKLNSWRSCWSLFLKRSDKTWVNKNTTKIFTKNTNTGVYFSTFVKEHFYFSHVDGLIFFIACKSPDLNNLLSNIREL